MHRLVKVALAIVIMLFIVPGVFAQSAQTGLLTTLYPDLKQMPAPPWLQEGLRFTYYTSSATIPEDGHLYYRDEDGVWVDRAGNHYRQEQATGAGGHGFTQIDVAAIESGMV